MQSQEYLGQIIKGLVEFPEEIRIERKNDERGILLTVNVAAQDMGKLIGKAGSTAKAIRHILKASGYKTQENICLLINEPGEAAPNY